MNLDNTSTILYSLLMKSSKCYSMRAVSAMTGLSAHVIRAWEKRYSAICPNRSSTNRRFYCQGEVERLTLLRQATQMGHAIGLIANLSKKDLKKLSLDSNSEPTEISDAPEAIQDEDFVDDHINICLCSVEKMDARAFENELLRTSIALHNDCFIYRFIVPLIQKIGERWHSGTLRIAQEHFASSILKTFLCTMRLAFNVEADAPGILITTPSGEEHELGALIASVIAASGGWNVTYLGANLPAEEIFLAAKERNVKAIGLSVVYPETGIDLVSEFTHLKKNLPADTTIFVGGQAVETIKVLIRHIGAVQVTDLKDFKIKLQLLAETY